MAKPASSKLKRLFFWLRTHKLVFIALAFTVLIIGFFVYEKVALEINKRAFQNARTAIDAVYADIVNQVGEPDDYKYSNTCSIYREVYTSGPIYCNLVSTFIYGVQNIAEANEKVKTIQSTVISNKLMVLTGSLSSSITATTVANAPYYASSDRYKNSGLDCVTNYIYDTPSEISLELKNKTLMPLEVTIGCNGKARAKFYSLNE